jgi:hypothetical protein
LSWVGEGNLKRPWETGISSRMTGSGFYVPPVGPSSAEKEISGIPTNVDLAKDVSYPFLRTPPHVTRLLAHALLPFFFEVDFHHALGMLVYKWSTSPFFGNILNTPKL